MADYLGMYNMKERVAFITGGSTRGIGSGSAQALAQAGASVFLVARREEKLREQIEAIESAGGAAAGMTCDVSNEEDVKRAIEKCVETFGRLDVMVLAAGVCGIFYEDFYDDLEDSENWDEVIGINLNGIKYAIKYGYPECAKNGVGSIVVISSMAALKVSGGMPYTAAKGALLRLVPWWAKKMGAEGVRVNAIAPGLIDTEMTNPPGWDTTDTMLKPAAEKTPMRKLATIEDCASTALFLASDAAGAITGQTIAVDAGEAMIE